MGKFSLRSFLISIIVLLQVGMSLASKLSRILQSVELHLTSRLQEAISSFYPMYRLCSRTLQSECLAVSQLLSNT